MQVGDNALRHEDADRIVESGAADSFRGVAAPTR